MKFAICNEVYQDWPLDKAFSHARQMGYQGVEIAPFTILPDVRHIDASRRTQLKQLAAEHELEIVGLHWLLAHTQGLHLTTRDASIRRETADYLAALARFCADIGGSVMVFGSPQQRNRADGISQAEANEHALEVLNRVAPVLEDLDVTLALEPLGPEEGNYWLTADETVPIIRQVNSPRVKLHLDVKAMSAEAKPIPQVIRENAADLVHFHANDSNRRGPGMGQIDFVPIMAALREIGYAGWVSVEVFDYSPGIEALVGESIRYLKSL